ncbi:unnamed protein product, partial [marine sediment metagenome]
TGDVNIALLSGIIYAFSIFAISDTFSLNSRQIGSLFFIIKFIPDKFFIIEFPRFF